MRRSNANGASVNRSSRVPDLRRRALLQQSFLSLMALSGGSLVSACGGGGSESVPINSDTDTGSGPGGSGSSTPEVTSNIANIGPLQGVPDANGLLLPQGFSSRVVARTGEYPVAASNYQWHGRPDGGATFATASGGWIYVSNSEMAPGEGGVGALEFDADGQLIDAFQLLAGTSVNCAGGVTPWQTWLSCEEFDRGLVWECYPLEGGNKPADARRAMGVFQHEAAATDPATGVVYLTEDRSDSCFYRFIPDRYGDLSSGRLQAAVVAQNDSRYAIEGAVAWVDIFDPSALLQPVRLQAQQLGAARFARGEGAWFHDGVAYFATTGDNVIWAYQPASETDGTLMQIYNRTAGLFPNDTTLNNVDNLTISAGGDVVVAEDGDNDALQVQAITAGGDLLPLLTLVGHTAEGGELAGCAFDPSGTRLYVSSQKGTQADLDLYGRTIGVVFEITGPFVIPSD